MLDDDRSKSLKGRRLWIFCRRIWLRGRDIFHLIVMKNLRILLLKMSGNPVVEWWFWV